MLTAAHCIGWNPSEAMKMRLLFGDHDLTTNSDTNGNPPVTRTVARMKMHARYKFPAQKCPACVWRWSS